MPYPDRVKISSLLVLIGGATVGLLCLGQTQRPAMLPGGLDNTGPRLIFRGIGPLPGGMPVPSVLDDRRNDPAPADDAEPGPPSDDDAPVAEEPAASSSEMVVDRAPTEELDEAELPVEADTVRKVFPPATPEMAGRSFVEALRLLPEADRILRPAYAESLMNETNRTKTPSLTTFWPKGATENHANDPQVAAGHWAVAVLTWGTLAFYDKAGTLLPATASFPNPTTMSVLFQKTVEQLDTTLNLNPTVAADPSFRLSAGQIGDARVEFDSFRKRWVVLATAKNNQPDRARWANLWVWSQRRTKFLVAVSVDENPANGFRTYGFDATPNDGACNQPSDAAPCPSSLYTPGNGGDYPSLGISSHHYLLTCFVAHQPLDGKSGFFNGAFAIVANASDLATGVSNPLVTAFYRWDVGGDEIAKGAIPVVSQQALTPTDYSFLMSRGTNRLALTAVTPTDPPNLVSYSWNIPQPYPIPSWFQKGSARQVDYGNIGYLPVKATQMGGVITMGWNDARNWNASEGDLSPSIHLLSLNLNGFPNSPVTIQKERVFGMRNVTDDDPTDLVGYGLPGAAMNKDGDLVVVYSRTSQKLFPQARYSAWLHDEPDLRPSRILHPGEGALPCGTPCRSIHFDTAGVALDPFDQTGIWIAHNYVSSANGFATAVGKVFGQQHPGLQVDTFSVGPDTTTAGQFVQMSFTIANRGDAPAASASVEFHLLCNTGAPLLLGTASLPVLKAGEVQARDYSLLLPQNLAPGQYSVLALAKVPVQQYTDGLNSRASERPLVIQKRVAGQFSN